MKHWLTTLALLLGTAAFATGPVPHWDLQNLDDPAAVIELARAHGHSKNASVAEIESLREAAARRLSEIGVEESRPFLRELAAMTPTATVTEMGCRAPYERILHPFDVAAARALHEIDVREQRTILSGALARAELGYVAEIVSAESSGAAAEALAQLAGEIPEARARELARVIVGDGIAPIPAGASHVIARIGLALSEAPTDEVFLRLHETAAMHLLLNSAQLPEAERAALLAAARRHPAVSSMAAVLHGNGDGLPLSEYLEKDGANAVLVLSRDRSENMTGELETVLRSSEDPAILKGAVAVLMLQDTAASHQALRRFTTLDTQPESLRMDVEAWLNR